MYAVNRPDVRDGVRCAIPLRWMRSDEEVEHDRRALWPDTFAPMVRTMPPVAPGIVRIRDRVEIEQSGTAAGERPLYAPCPAA